MISFFQRQRKLLCRLFLLGLLAGLAASWIFGSFYCAPCNHIVSLPKDLTVEKVAFPSASASTIHGWLVAPGTNRGVVILQHGIHADKSTLVTRAKLFSKNGYAVLMFDFQAHGESIGQQITFGYLESCDSQAAVEFAKNKFPGKPIAVVGISLGAAAAALAKPPLDVQAMVLEMMYSTIVDATKDRIEMRLGPAGRCLSPFLTTQLRLRSRFSADDLRPLVAVATIPAPKLFLAGTDDHETKFSEARAIFSNAAEPKSFVPFEGAHHEDLLNSSPELYTKTVLEFLDRHLK